MLPGLDGTGRLFGSFAEALANSVETRIVAFPSDAAPDYPSIEASVAPLLPREHPFVLLGESFSGPLALSIAGKAHPNLVGVILVASFVKRPVAWLPPLSRHLFGSAARFLPGRRLALKHLLLGGDGPVSLIETAMACIDDSAASVLAGRVRAALNVDATGSLAGCPVPIFYLRGARDRLIRKTTVAELKEIRPDLRCVTVDAPHFVLQTVPKEAASAVLEFLDEVSGHCRS